MCGKAFISKMTGRSITGDEAFIKLLFAGNNKTKYYLTMIGNKWLIDNIENAFAEN
jgi:hypothetical protein